MPRFKVAFKKLIQDSEDCGSDDEQMVSRVFFSLDVDGNRIGDFVADLKQVVGSDIETGDIEVGSPHGYHGPFDHKGFSEAASKYFRSLTGSQGTGIHMAKGESRRIHDKRFARDAEYNF